MRAVVASAGPIRSPGAAEPPPELARTPHSSDLAAEPGWVGLYRLGAAGALFTVLVIPVAVLAHLLWPPPAWAPGAAGDWFAYVRANRTAGLINLDAAMALGLVLAMPLQLALYVALRPVNRSGALVAAVAALLGTALHLVSIAPVELVALGDAHAAAASDLQRATYLAAGEAALSAYYGTTFHVGYVVGYVAYVAFGLLMLRATDFGRGAAYLGIATGLAGFGFYLPSVGTLASVLVVLLVGAWNALVARRLLRLAHPPGEL